jgi:hypothetical protein
MRGGVMQIGVNEMNGNSMLNLEKKLSNMLKPVKPDPVFLNSLKTKLTQTPSVILESSKQNIWLLLFGAGIFAGAFILWIIGVIKKFKK